MSYTFCGPMMISRSWCMDALKATQGAGAENSPLPSSIESMAYAKSCQMRWICTTEPRIVIWNEIKPLPE